MRHLILNIEMSTENRMEIKRIGTTDIYNDVMKEFGTTFQLNSEIKSDLTKNYETYPVFLKKEIPLFH